ncbi:hypothetical protein KEM55_007362 [Ascosphaera atra]|nr:hypothetical protein KEM55_007362 [Ascosphaera atra]
MAPLIDMFPVSEIPQRMRVETKDLKAKYRKGNPQYLDECPLYEMLQYSCNPPDKEVPPAGEINCDTIVRLFRR